MRVTRHLDRNMKTQSVWLLVVVVALAGGAVYKYGGTPEDKKEAAKKPSPPVPVIVAQAGLRDVPVMLDVVGRGEAYETVTLKSRIDGQVVDVPFAEGQRVAAGDVLIRLDPADFKARVAQAEAALVRDQALLKKARADVDRYQTLQKQGFVSEEKVAETRANADAMEATVQADRASLELARLQLGYTTLRAPFAGIVGAKLVFPGAAVKVNETALAVVNRVQPLYVSFAVPEKHLPRIRAAMARGGIKVDARVPGDARQVYSGDTRFIDNAVDSSTGTIRMKAELPNKNGLLASGQFLDVSLVLDTLRDAVVVPAEAVQQGPNGGFVHVVKADAGIEIRNVEIAIIREGWAVIAKGLAEGETVVTDGHSRLVPGAKVKIKTPDQGKAGNGGGSDKGDRPWKSGR
jgi:multidrug efflux system membrane fusion protein